jgi:RNA polymerase sigma factor (sigma-70 family)
VDIVGLYSKTAKDAVSRYGRNCSREDREDLTQDCLLKLLEVEDNIEERFKEEGPEKANNYVYGICHNKIMDVIKVNQKHSNLASLDDYNVLTDIQEHIAEVKSAFGVSEQDLDEAVKQLPRTEQHVIRSLYFHNTTERDLAASMNRGRRWVREVRDEAVKQLRVILESK